MKMMNLARQFGTRVLLAVVFILPLMTAFAAPASAANISGWVPKAVFTMTNAATGNEVVVFERSRNGSISQTSYSTGGLGSGAGLGSQGSVLLSEHDLLLFVVNAGSNSLSVFGVLPRRLVLLDVVDSGGEMPISVTQNGRNIYVLNAGGSGNISGFKLGLHGKLIALDGSSQPLSNGGAGASPGPAQISFSPDGRQLVVTEKGTNLITVYDVNRYGVAGSPSSYPSAGMTPFGFAFDNQGHLIVSEAFGGAPDASTLSSYRVGHGTFELISGPVPTEQTAACWVVVSKNGRYAYDTNTGSGSISSFRIESDGSLTLLDPQAGLMGDGSTPIDVALTNDGRFLAAIGSGSNMIHAFEVNADGSLTAIGSASVPDGSLGLAAR